MILNLYSGSVTTSYSYNSTYDIYTPTAWDMDLIGVLSDATSCLVHEEKNGVYELTMTYAVTGVNADEIQADRIIGVYCPLRNSVGENYFRIYRVERDLSGQLRVTARHVSGDLVYHAVTRGGLSEISAVSGGIQTFAGAVLHSYGAWLRHATYTKIPFAFGGNASTSTGFQMDFCTGTSSRAYLGGEELQGYDKTALQAFPGSVYEWNKWNINLWSSRGTARDVQISYGTNMSDLLADDDSDGIYTYVCGYYLQTDGVNFKKYTSSLYATNYTSMFPFARTEMVDFSSDVMNAYPDGATTAEITAFLNTLAQAERDRLNAAGSPLRTVTIDAVAQAISGVYLCDSVHVFYRRNGITLNTEMEIVAYTWDVLMQRYSELTLGAIQMNLAKEIVKNGSKSSVDGIMSNIATLQNSVLTVKTDVENIVTSADAGSGGNYTKYVKFADGTMIAAIYLTTSVVVGTAWGQIFYSTQISLGSFPEAFTSAPYVVANIQNSGDSWIGNVAGVTTTNAGTTYIYRPVRATSAATFHIVVIAIGSWR